MGATARRRWRRAAGGGAAVALLLAGAGVGTRVAAGPLPSGQVVRVQTGAPGKAIRGNLTVTGPVGAGYAAVYPCAEGWPGTSNLNYAAGWTIANAVTVRADANGEICILTYRATQVIWDQTAEVDEAVHNAVRLLDTRSSGGPVPARGTVKVQTGAPGKAVRGNLTVTGTTAPGYAAVYPCAEGWSGTSNLNYAAGWTIANAVTAKADANGELCVYVYESTHVIWDQTAEVDEAVHNAVRLLDTRSSGGPVPARGTVKVQTGAPGKAVRGNLTVTGTTAPGYAAVYPCAEGWSGTSNLNYAAGWTIANAVTAKADANGELCVYVYESTHVIWDQTAEVDEAAHNAVRLLDTRTRTTPFLGTELLTVGTDGAPLTGDAWSPSTSADGRYVAYLWSSGPFSDDPDAPTPVYRVYVRDRVAGTTDPLMAVNVGGVGDFAILDVTSLSADGRYVSFTSAVPGLVLGDTNDAPDVFVFDRQARTIVRASVGAGGGQAPDGGYGGRLSADGRYLLFESPSGNLVAGDTNDESDLFVRDLTARTTVRVSVGTGGVEADFGATNGALSGDGRYVAFTSGATTLAPDDEDGADDVFVRDLQTGVTERLTASSFDESLSAGAPSLSADGNVVAYERIVFDDDGSELRDVYVRDRVAGTTTRLSEPATVDGISSSGPIVSADGRFVVWDTTTTVDGASVGIVVHDRAQGSSQALPVTFTGAPADGPTVYAVVSPDGRTVVFVSMASNLIGFGVGSPSSPVTGVYAWTREVPAAPSGR